MDSIDLAMVELLRYVSDHGTTVFDLFQRLAQGQYESEDPTIESSDVSYAALRSELPSVVVEYFDNFWNRYKERDLTFLGESEEARQAFAREACEEVRNNVMNLLNRSLGLDRTREASHEEGLAAAVVEGPREDEPVATPTEGEHPEGEDVAETEAEEHHEDEPVATPAEGEHPEGEDAAETEAEPEAEAEEHHEDEPVATPAEGEHPEGEDAAETEAEPEAEEHHEDEPVATPTEGEHPEGEVEDEDASYIVGGHGDYPVEEAAPVAEAHPEGEVTPPEDGHPTDGTPAEEVTDEEARRSASRCIITSINPELIRSMPGFALVKEPMAGNISIYGFRDREHLHGVRDIEEPEVDISSGYYVNLVEFVSDLGVSIGEEYGNESTMSFRNADGEIVPLYTGLNNIMNQCRRAGAIKFGNGFAHSTITTYEDLAARYNPDDLGNFKGILLTKGLYVRRDLLIELLRNYQVVIDTRGLTRTVDVDRFIPRAADRAAEAAPVAEAAPAPAEGEADAPVEEVAEAATPVAEAAAPVAEAAAPVAEAEEAATPAPAEGEAAAPVNDEERFREVLNALLGDSGNVDELEEGRAR